MDQTPAKLLEQFPETLEGKIREYENWKTKVILKFLYWKSHPLPVPAP